MFNVENEITEKVFECSQCEKLSMLKRHKSVLFRRKIYDGEEIYEYCIFRAYTNSVWKGGLKKI